MNNLEKQEFKNNSIDIYRKRIAELQSKVSAYTGQMNSFEREGYKKGVRDYKAQIASELKKIKTYEGYIAKLEKYD